MSSLVLPTRYSGDGVNVRYERNRKLSREEKKIAALAIGEKKRKRPIINRGYHEVCSGYVVKMIEVWYPLEL